MAVTSIQVSSESKIHWDSFKNHPSESYEAMINRILKTTYDEDEKLTNEDLTDIIEATNDFKAGRYTSNKDLRKELGL